VVAISRRRIRLLNNGIVIPGIGLARRSTHDVQL